ncbi:MAG TPA: type II toxin-antitoxin system HicA family toxin [Sedimentisphaerales bacterium]|nr:type II toxin-antitoxin system HicA family toxin [Sedimentisphaerales bacterium]
MTAGAGKGPLLSGKKIVKAFEKAGYYRVGQRGSHIKIRNDTRQITLIIPDHKEVDRWTLGGIIRDAELSIEEFIRLVK